MSEEPSDINPTFAASLREHIEWINRVTELGADADWHSAWKAINELDPDRLPGLVLVLVMARAGELNQLRASAAKLGAAPLN
jgi:hypothetical protein